AQKSPVRIECASLKRRTLTGIQGDFGRDDLQVRRLGLRVRGRGRRLGWNLSRCLVSFLADAIRVEAGGEVDTAIGDRRVAADLDVRGAVRTRKELGVQRLAAFVRRLQDVELRGQFAQINLPVGPDWRAGGAAAIRIRPQGPAL